MLAWAYPEMAVSLGEEGVRYGVTLTGPGIATARGLHPAIPRRGSSELYGRPQHREGDTWEYIAPDDENGLHVMRVRFDARPRLLDLPWLVDGVRHDPSFAPDAGRGNRRATSPGAAAPVLGRAPRHGAWRQG